MAGQAALKGAELGLSAALLLSHEFRVCELPPR